MTRKETERGQGSLEILLLIAGAVLVTVVILLISISSTQGQNTLVENGIFDYIQSTQDAAGLTGPPNVPATCNDGVFDPLLEECDAGDFGVYLDGVDACVAYDSIQFDGGDLLCTGCMIDTSSCDPGSGGGGPPVCGDGQVTPPEVCDTGNGSSCPANSVCQSCTQCIPAPQIASFSGDWYDSKTQLFYAATGTGNLVYQLARTLNPNDFLNFDFDNPGSVTVILPGNNSTAFLDASVTNGITYYYSLRACDDTGLCTVSPTIVDLTPHIPMVSFSVGASEIMFDYSYTGVEPPIKKCESLDVPDTHARAVWMGADLILDAGNAPNAYLRRGSNFSSLQSVCTPPAFVSSLSNNPSSANNYEWIPTVYKKGNKLYGIVHNEFHDSTNPGICGTTNPGPGNPCWYNTLTFAEADATASSIVFTQPAAPTHVIAAPPLQWNATSMNTQPYGYMEPTNIISRVEGGQTYYYSFFRAYTQPGNQGISGICVMRTNNLDSPGSWRAWNGSGFSLSMGSPYPTPGTTPCTFISSQSGPNNPLSNIIGGITFNTFLQEYIMVASGITADYSGTPTLKCGVWYARSKDLINWQPYELLFQSHMVFTHSACDTAPPEQIAYGTMLDEDQINDLTDPNFEKSDDTFYTYYTIFNNGFSGPGSLDRDLVKRKITLSKT